jgi:hypothetical protein
MRRVDAGLPCGGRPDHLDRMFRPRVFFALWLACAFALLAGCATSKKKDYPETVARFLLEAGPAEAGATVQLPRSGTTIRVAPKTFFTEYDIVSCTAVFNEFGRSLVFKLTPEASRDLFRLTATSRGKRLVTVVNGVAIGARRIEDPLSDGYIVTYVEIDDERLDEFAKNIVSTSTDGRKELEKRNK